MTSKPQHPPAYQLTTTVTVPERLLRKTGMAKHIDLLTIEWNEPMYKSVGDSTIMDVRSPTNPLESAYHVITPVEMWDSDSLIRFFTMLYATYSAETGELIDTNCINADGELGYAPDYIGREAEQERTNYRKRPDWAKARIQEIAEQAGLAVHIG